MLNALTIDVEDYFQVSAFERYVKREDWPIYPLRVVDNTRRVLRLLEEFDVRATFFVLGWVAERCPTLVKEILNAGHEIASHGYKHQRVNTQTRQEFREDIRKSKVLLEHITGKSVYGYRAPSYSISMNTLWAFDELIEAGYHYDSSVFPIRHDFYGIPDWPRFPFNVQKFGDGYWLPERDAGDHGVYKSGLEYKMLEIPISTMNVYGKNIPIAGGGYFRLFPYAFTQWGLNQINQIEKKPFVFYLHPWELDPGQPRVTGISFKTRFRHYLNLDRTEGRFRRLLADFTFLPICDLIDGIPCQSPEYNSFPSALQQTLLLEFSG